MRYVDQLTTENSFSKRKLRCRRLGGEAHEETLKREVVQDRQIVPKRFELLERFEWLEQSRVPLNLELLNRPFLLSSSTIGPLEPLERVSAVGGDKHGSCQNIPAELQLRLCKSANTNGRRNHNGAETQAA